MLKNRKLWNGILPLFLFVAVNCFGQAPDLLRLEYTLVPENDSGIRTGRYRFLFNAPIKLKNEDILLLGSEFNQFNYRTASEFPFETRELNRLYVLDFNFGYITKWNENWQLISLLTPRLASNFTGKILAEDLRINATAAFLKNKNKIDKPFLLVIGLAFNSSAGVPFPLPLVLYSKRFHPKYSYTLGVPVSNFKYHLSEKHTFKTSLFLDGYNINIQNDIIIPDNNLGSNISLTALVAGIGYQYNITKLISLYGVYGYTLFQNGTLRDDDRDEVFVLNNIASQYFRVGFKVGIF